LIDRPYHGHFNFDWGKKQNCEEEFISERFKITTPVLRTGIFQVLENHVAMYLSRTICVETFVSLPHHHAGTDAQALWLSIVFLLGRNFCGAVQNVQNQGIIMSHKNISMPFHVINCTSFGQTFLHSQELILSAIFGA
jgi:hypothetical protein